MRGIADNTPRNVIPRWRTFNETIKLGELKPSTHPPSIPPPTPQPHDPLAQTKADWKKNQTIGHAADLVGAALFLERSHEAQDAIEFLQRHESQTSKWLKELIEQSSPNPDITPAPTPTPSISEIAAQRIQELRRRLHEEPKDPITQVDLAHAYVTLGHNGKASEHITVAQQLAPNNRFVLRSASRFWLHFNDKDQAHHILTQSDRTPHDPWLMAAEIAVGNSILKTPVFAQKAHSAILEQTFQESHISELASAIATTDWNNGAVRQAKRNLDQSLRKPTENSLAQAVWMSSQDDSLKPTIQPWSLPNAFEAQTRDFFLKKEWEKAAEQCKLWQKDQPFSRAPGIDGSFISAVALDNFQLAKQFAQIGLVANPNDFLLLNNLAVALINLNDFDAARKYLSQINLSKVNDANSEIANITKLATTGLLHYRIGNTKKGRQLYIDARSLAKKLPEQLSFLTARATAAHALEESPHYHNYHQLIDEAVQLLERQSDPACELLLTKLKKVKSSPTPPA